MGMELTSNWTCDRCTKVTVVKLGTVPENWKAIINPCEIKLSKEFSPDMGMNFEPQYICGDCIDGFIKWMQEPIEKYIQQVADEADASEQSDDVERTKVYRTGELEAMRRAAKLQEDKEEPGELLKDDEITKLESDIQ